MRKSGRAWLYVLVVCGVFFVTRSFPFWGDGGGTVPLGYDPGLYKMMRETYIGLGAWWDFEILPQWVQHMYEPLLGMQGAVISTLFSSMGGGGVGGDIMVADWILTWGWVVVCGGLPVCMYLVGKKVSSVTAIFAGILGVLSFVQREVFRWGYRKQLVGVCLLLVVMRLWMDRRWWMSIPIISAVLLVNRPAAVLLAVIGGVRAVVQRLSHRRFTPGGGVVGALVGGVLLALPIGWMFWQSQIIALRGTFVASFGDLPQRNDTYQQGGSFLTTHEYLRGGWRALVGGVLGVGVWMRLWWRTKAKNRNESEETREGESDVTQKNDEVTTWMPIVIGTLVSVIRVGAQGFFFQRMMGYLDVFLILMMAYVCGILRERLQGVQGGFGTTFVRNRLSKILFAVGLFVIIGVTDVMMGLSLDFGVPRRESWIKKSELVTIKTIAKYTPADAVIIVPSRWYSPWVGGWSQRDVVAPALFELNTWSQDERAKIRLGSSDQEICDAIIREYGYHQRPLYVLMGPREPVINLSGRCFEDVMRDTVSKVRLQKVVY